MSPKTETLLKLLDGQPVIPVIKVERTDDAVPLARALAAGGLRVIEITLRTKSALDSIRRVAAEVPEAIVGAGTILNPTQFHQAAEAGSRFIVSPGLTDNLVAAAADSPVPLLPGCTTLGEMMGALDAGIDFLKFFPAEQAGGAPFVKAVASVIPAIRFCPTGGIGPANANDYLSLPNIVCVGGSWVAPDKLINEGRWSEITALASEADRLRKAA